MKGRKTKIPKMYLKFFINIYDYVEKKELLLEHKYRLFIFSIKIKHLNRLKYIEICFEKPISIIIHSLRSWLM